jgi:DNA-binding response OmpR family regulator
LIPEKLEVQQPARTNFLDALGQCTVAKTKKEIAEQRAQWFREFREQWKKERYLQRLEKAVAAIQSNHATLPDTNKPDFEFSNGQAFFRGVEIDIGAGREYEHFKLLAKNFGKVVPYSQLDDTSVSNASEQLRKEINHINSALKRSQTGLLIESKRTEGYVLRSGQ